MEPQDSQPSQKPTNGYGKRPVWQWILIYVVIAIVVYGLIYLLFIHDSGSSTGGY
jgi:hypothetical protein